MKSKKPSKKPTPKTRRAKKLTIDDLRKVGGGLMEADMVDGDGGRKTTGKVFSEETYEIICGIKSVDGHESC